MEVRLRLLRLGTRRSTLGARLFGLIWFLVRGLSALVSIHGIFALVCIHGPLELGRLRVRKGYSLWP